ncbi:DMT family transporter [uncultured Roseobacter sp.]|uniref:DMT family transporter n=1 Tax=uncultured Roseobacter sp. TaxID=114847 RepID=UPI00261F102E|nr:DMT family transporter [uncultured Roseobacter sp.]
MIAQSTRSLSPNIVGALMMVASMACFTINDALIKATGGAVPLFQLLVLRGLLATALIGGLAWSRGAFRARVSRQDWGWIALRSVSEIGAAYFFITALLNMPLANVTAILQLLPLAVTLGSALIYREAVGWRRMTAIAVGFCGMLLIVRPGAEGFTIWSLYALVAVLCVTARDLIMRRISSAAPSLLVTFSTSLGVLLAAGAASLTIPWVPVSPTLAALIGGASVFVVGGYYFSVQVMRQGDVSFVAPFRYTGLLWALVLGWVLFGEWPAPLTLLGAGIIVGASAYTMVRERRLLRHPQ